MTKDLNFNEISGAIRQKKFMPVYLLQGEEGYYIDRLTDLLMAEVLDDSERDFNQTILYGLETNAGAIINICRRYPMMAERQLVVLKEAQQMRSLDDLTPYMKQPMPSTILVINHKNGKLDGRKKLSGEIAKAGIVFESKKVYENQVPDFITRYLREKQIEIEWQATQLLADYLGADLSKIANELDKLSILLPDGRKQVTSALVEQNIGISKDFNNYELQRAIASGDHLKAQRIARYFDENQKKNPIVLTLNVLFGFFANLMICHYESDRSDSHLLSALGFKWSKQLEDYRAALKRYSAQKTMYNISLIRQCDARSKGFGNLSTSPGKLLEELLYRLMH
jgi:DNA polymerase-3 subunit delta